MTTKDIALRLVETCRRGDYVAAQRELYAVDAVSIEPEGRPDSVARGLTAIAEKTRAFDEMFDVHRNVIGDPIVADPFFACTMSVDVTVRKTGARKTLSEICVYEVKAGKIVREQFFYQPQG